MFAKITKTPWRNGSASDSRSEGCVFESRRGHVFSHNFEFWKCCFYRIADSESVVPMRIFALISKLSLS